MLTVFLVKIDWSLENFTYPEDEVEKIKWIPRETLRRELESYPEKYLPQVGSWKRYIV